MNCDIATAFLPNFVGFPFQGGPNSSSVHMPGNRGGPKSPPSGRRPIFTPVTVLPPGVKGRSKDETPGGSCLPPGASTGGPAAPCQLPPPPQPPPPPPQDEEPPPHDEELPPQDDPPPHDDAEAHEVEPLEDAWVPDPAHQPALPDRVLPVVPCLPRCARTAAITAMNTSKPMKRKIRIIPPHLPFFSPVGPEGP